MADIRSVTYEDAFAVTASDTVDDPAGPFAGFYVGGGSGTIKVHTLGGHDVTLAGLITGTIVPLAITRVYSSTTTATSVLGLRAMPYKARPPTS